MLYTTKTRDQRSVLSSSVKYLSIVLDPKLSCRLRHDSRLKCNIAILINSQAAISTLYSVATSSRLIGKYKNALNSLAGVILLWVPVIAT